MVLFCTSLLPVSAGESPETQSRIMSFTLGRDYGYLAMVYQNGTGNGPLAFFQKEISYLCPKAQLKVPQLPARTGNSSKDGAAAVSQILKQAPAASLAVKKGYGTACSALFDVGMRIQILQIIYHPGNKEALVMIAELEKAGLAAGVSKDLWSNLVKLSREGKSETQVKAACVLADKEIRKALWTDAYKD